MYNGSNVRFVQSGERFSFQVPKTGTRFTIWVKFITEDEGGTPMKGVQILSTPDAPVPEGAKFHSGFGQTFGARDENIVFYKGGNSSSFTDIDGENYELFKVRLVDSGKDGMTMSGEAGGVLYFHAVAAIPPELGGEGVLKEDPMRGFECG